MPQTKRSKGRKEIRVQPTRQKFELRKNADGSRSVTGYFATFNQQSHDLGFKETLLPGCFTESLRSNPVQCLFNHENGKLLGRTESGTLQVEEDATGLRFDVKLPSTSYANDLIVLMQRGDAFECSFGFSVPEGGDEWSVMPDGTLLRTISEAILFEGSVLVSPAAYPNTSASLRSLPSNLRDKLKQRGFFDADIAGDDDDLDDIDNSEGTDDDNTDAGKDDCECGCDACVDGDCEDCTAEDCDDENCRSCPAQDEQRADRARLMLHFESARRHLCD